MKTCFSLSFFLHKLSPFFFLLEIIAFKIGKHKPFAQLCKGRGQLIWAPHLCLLSPKLSPALKNTFISVTNSLTMCCYSAVLWAGSGPMGHSWITSIAPFISYPILRAPVSWYLGFVAPRPSVPFLSWLQMAVSFSIISLSHSVNLTQLMWHQLLHTAEAHNFTYHVIPLLFVLLLNDSELRRRKSLQLPKGCCSDLK